MDRLKLKIIKEEFFNNGKIMINHFDELEKDIRMALSSYVSVKIIERNEKNKDTYYGINATSLNVALRELFGNIPNMNKETHVENGIFYHDTKEGFDFSLYDYECNLNRIHNYFIGYYGLHNGEIEIKKIYKKVLQDELEWKDYLKSINSKYPLHTDISVIKKELTIVGEFQFGNWALIYRDLFRLLNADVNPGIDYYIYVAATGKLKKMLSSNIVTYERACQVINENRNIVKTPMWVIGLDID